MRSNNRGIMAVGLALALVPAAARAQTSMGEFGGYPSNYTPGPGASVYRGMAAGGGYSGAPAAPYTYYGPGTAAPLAGGGYSGYTTPYTPRSYGPSYSYRPGVTNYRAYSSGYYAPGPGLRAAAPGASYYLPGTTTYGTYRYPGTASYGSGLWRPGYSTYIAPTGGAYVMPRSNFIRRYVR